MISVRSSGCAPKRQGLPVRSRMASTNTLDQFDESIAGEILGGASLREDEEAFANYRGASGWCLLTTKRLIWKVSGVLSSLFWSEIALAQQPRDVHLPPASSTYLVKGLEKRFLSRRTL